MNFGRLALKAFGGALTYWQQGPAKLTDPVLGGWLGYGARSFAGKTVTVDSALQLAAVWACVRLIAETIATLPCNVYTADGKGRKLARSHPLYALLHDAPNADQTAVEFWEMMAAGLLLWGNAYAAIDRIFGRVVALTPLQPSLLTVRRNDDGSVRYTYHDPVLGPRDYPEDDILHIRGFSLDGLLGLSPIAQAAQSIGLALAAEETAGSLFAHGMRTGGYVAAPQVLNKVQREQAEGLLRQFQGASNAGKTPILEAGWKFEPFTLPPQEAELLATRAFEVEEIARWYRVPPTLIGHNEKTTTWGTGVESLMTGFVMLTLRPWLKRLEMSAKRRLLSPGERGSIEIEFNVTALLRGDSAARAAYYTAMVQNGLYSRDEVRALENMPLRGGAADLLTIQSQNVPIDVAAGLAAPPAADVQPAPVPPQKVQA